MGTHLGELLVAANVVTPPQLEVALRAQASEGRRLIQVLVGLGFATEAAISAAIARRMAIPWVSVYHIDFQRSLLAMVPRDLADRHCLVPVYLRKEKNLQHLYVLTDDPTDDVSLGEVAAFSGIPVRPAVAPTSDIRLAIDAYYYRGIEVPDPTAPLPRLTSAKGGRAVSDVPRPERVTPLPSEVLEGPQSHPAAPRAEVDLRPPADFPGAEPELEAKELSLRPRAPMRELTFLDGTTISIPAPPKRNKRSDPPDDLSLRDVISALRAAAHGADASEILGSQPRWEAMCATLLAVLAKRGLISDREFLEELRKG